MLKVQERFIKYVKIHSTSDPSNEVNPSSERERDLARVLYDEMIEIGMTGVTLSDNCYVYGFIEATKGYENAPKIGFIAHMDTSPDFSGENVNPIVHENYDGEDIVLENRTIKVSDFPHLTALRGHTLITSDGNTLLGADDKAGIAEIMYVCDKIITDNIPHGKIAVCFTPDEEVGMGADGFDVPFFGCDFAYTVDGGAPGEIESENFNAAEAIIEVNGFNVHPGSAKNTMINASLVAMEANAMLPSADTPSHTEGREGFFHLCSIEGTVEHAKAEYIIRDHDEHAFAHRMYQMEHIVSVLNTQYGEGTVTLSMREQYRNMSEKLRECPMAIEIAEIAIQKASLAPRAFPIRGGTDGARLSFMGLPCPNLGTGGYAFHGPYEHISIEGMEKSAEIVLNIVEEAAKR